MPMYTWVRKDTLGTEEEIEVEVVRTFSDYQLPPTIDEHPDAESHEWIRIISGGHMIDKRGPGWNEPWSR